MHNLTIRRSLAVLFLAAMLAALGLLAAAHAIGHPTAGWAWNSTPGHVVAGWAWNTPIAGG